MCVWIRYIAPPAPYDPYAGYPVAQVPMPPPTPVPAPSGYAPIQVVIMFNLLSPHFSLFMLLNVETLVSSLRFRCSTPLSM